MPLTFVTASIAFVRTIDAGAEEGTGGGAAVGPEVLTVRKRGTDRFMLVGGKLEAGESALDAAVREAGEEVGAAVDPTRLTLLGHWTSPAANEVGALVTSTVHVCRDEVAPVVAAEIEEFRWLPIDAAAADDLAPLLTEHVLPALRRQR